ncbi:MAG: acyl carrier protein [Caldiserica bacterium CG02_land_8_20_14_3_00_36_38]|jgi:acyl carrier protein|nr:acyl carrier protein [Caldisericota bacterium]OIP12336.1 MAG: acyl carrier protein [Caldisericum sp. CG2_30_36_11]PIP49763.1 MAG: acyl carrier protein [Caldiserica bacterium CG23_combo_of_CG06-09_8_20_14_all_35_60]PIV56233.1 MAG: acyl carrier protein [Caldiserica bacterium CG02_land_8_20_14_3_00_36_38]PIX29706.1 MAG: acyl carrier protein [Caldiserica bacterium CG_4_8_14_3_um_filter_35_18]
MEEKEIREKVVAIIKDKLGVEDDKIVDSAKYVDDLGADSLTLVDIAMALEDEFGMKIPDEDIEKITTIGSTLQYIKDHIK